MLLYTFVLARPSYGQFYLDAFLGVMYSVAMRILINLLNFRPGRIGGTETYLRELIAHLPEAARGEQIALLLGSETADEFRSSRLEIVTAPVSNRSIAGWRLAEALLSGCHARSIEKVVAAARPDVVLYPQQSMFPQRVDCRSVVIIHDLYHLTFPQYCSRLQHWFRNRTYPAAVARADRVIAVSDVTKQSVVTNYGCPPEKIAVVRHGIRQLNAEGVAPSQLVAGPYLYYPAVTHPHKNHELLLYTIAGLRAQARFPYRMVFTGARSKQWKHLEQLIEKLSLGDVVQHLGYVAYGAVLELIRGAKALVFPSQCEGFGIPVIEAAMLGCKMITSRLDVFSEIGVPDRYRIDFADLNAFDRALHDLAPAHLLRRPSTWLECARETLDVLCKTVNSPPVIAGPHFELSRTEQQSVLTSSSPRGFA